MEIHERLGIKKKLLEDIIITIIEYKNIDRIVVFGSRASNDYTYNSDIDLAVFSDQLTSRDVNIIKDNLEELPTALKFDVVGYSILKKELLKTHINNSGITIYEQKKDSQHIQ